MQEKFTYIIRNSFLHLERRQRLKQQNPKDYFEHQNPKTTYIRQNEEITKKHETLIRIQVETNASKLKKKNVEFLTYMEE